MPDERFQNQYRIASSRATWHDYNGGMYFVTVCTQNKEHYFGEIQNGVMNLTEIGKYANNQFQDATNHYPYTEIPLWIVMPNHIHCIALIDGTVETMCTSSLQRKQRWKHNNVDKEMQIISLNRGKLSTTIGGIKRAVTHFSNLNKLPFAWQPRFHDRIIRNNTEMNQIAEYIENNVARWEYDRFYGEQCRDDVHIVSTDKPLNNSLQQNWNLTISTGTM